MAATRPEAPLTTESDPRPVVRRPAAGLPGSAIAAIAAVLALLLFLYLNGRRHHPPQQAVSASTDVLPDAPPLSVPPEVQPVPPKPSQAIETTTLPPRITRPSPPPQVQVVPSAPVIMPAEPIPSQPSPAHLNTPALVLDADAGDSGASGSSGAPAGSAGAGGGDDAPVRTTIIRNRTTIMPTGTIIPAVLETPIDSARPGLVRAIVSEDARGFDGQQVLIPKGSRLIGEYQSDVRSGQNRVLVTWTRLIRSDGVAIRIGSPAADALGGAGIPGHVNSFFFQRFASAVLQSALTVGVNLASRPGNGSVIVGLPTSGTGTIGQDLLPGSDLKPKITVKQGAVLNVFVAHDLDFSGSPTNPRDKAR